MNKPLLVLGLLVILGMCLVPPWQVEDYRAFEHRAQRAADAVINLEGTRGPTSARADHTSQRIMYRAVWAPPEWEGERGHHEYSGRVNAGMLLVQILFGALFFGALAYMAGPSSDKAERAEALADDKASE